MQFAAPSAGDSGDSISAKDLVGQLLIIRPVEHATGIKTTFGEKDGIRLDLCVLTQQANDGSYGAVYRNALWLQGKLVGALKRQIGELVLARMAIGVGKPGQHAPYELEDATQDPQACQYAEQWINSHPEFANTPKPPAATPTTTAAVATPQPVATPVPQPAEAAAIDPAVLAQLGPEARAQLKALGI